MPDVTVPQEDNKWAEKAFNSTVAAMLSAISLSGTTAKRPVTFLWVGRPYFDTSINRPIWLRDLNPAVWIRADGVVV